MLWTKLCKAQVQDKNIARKILCMNTLDSAEYIYQYKINIDLLKISDKF